MKKLVCLKFKKVLAFALSLAVTLGCFAGMGFTASASIASTWGMLELESKDKVWISTGLGNEAYLKFIPKCTGTYVLESSSTGDAFVTLYDVAENAIATNDNGKDEENFRLAARLTGGATYYYGVKFTDPRYTGTCLLDHYFTDLECEHENGVYSAGQSATCHSDGYTPGYWCDDCECWYMGHDRIDGGHLDTKEDTDDLCDRCGGEMPSATGEIGPTARPYTVKFQFYVDGSMDIFGNDYIRNAAMSNLIYLKQGAKQLKICNGVKYIEENVFSDFIALETVELPESITSIRGSSFSGCVALKSINIPKTVEYIAWDAFSGCRALADVWYGGTSQDRQNLDIGTGNDYLINADWHCVETPNPYTFEIENGAVTITDVVGTLEGEVVIPDKIENYPVVYIGDYAFMSSKGITSVVIPDSVVEIGESAFEYCTNLNSVSVGSGVKKIGKDAFNSCNINDVYITDLAAWCEMDFFNKTSNPFCNARNFYVNRMILEELIIPSTVTEIADYTFSDCDSLTDVKFHDNVVSIGAEAFSNCDRLKQITLPKNLKYLGEFAFDCYNVEMERLELPAGIERIGDGAFSNCRIVELAIADSNPYYSCVDGVLFNKEKTKLLQYPRAKHGQSYTTPSTVITIGKSAFYNCKNLHDVTLTNKVTKIEKYAFSACTWLEKIRLPLSIKNIEQSSFGSCLSLREVYYVNGTEQGKASIDIGEGNEYLINANWIMSKCQHVAAPASCTVPSRCQLCDEVLLPAHGHGWVMKGNDLLTKTDRCVYCGLTRQHQHIYVAATCTAAQKCYFCGEVSGTALGHKYTYECDKTCNICGESRDAYHNYTSECDYECNYCGLKRMVKHKYSVFTTKATFSKDGSTGESCTVCGMGISTDIKAVKSVKLSATEYTYNGKARKPSVTVKDSAGKKLKNGTDYTVSYSKGCKKVGSYKVTVTLKGKYSGKKVLTFKINPKATKISKVTAAKKSLKLKIAKQTTETTGYEVQYSTSKKFTKSTTKTATVKKAKTTSLTLKKLKAKKTYYLKIRTYKTVGGKKFYSAWSKVTSKKTK